MPAEKKDFRHHNPYAEAKAYWKLCRGTLPIPYEEKQKPPTNFTGYDAPYPLEKQVEKWIADNDPHNICLRLAAVDAETELIGIDVDHYDDKIGGDTLAELEARLGPLGDTWIATSRTDGISGIRFFRVPKGLAFRGKAGKCIDIISKGYRYAIVWPSVHPEGETYWWFPPGVVPDEEGRKRWNPTIPLPGWRDIPMLPQVWIDYLTTRRIPSELKDVTTKSNELRLKWARETYNDGSEEACCDRMLKSIEQQKRKIDEDASSHDKVTDFHWHFYSLALEGHTGWEFAIDELERHWLLSVLEPRKGSNEPKRWPEDAQGELYRSWDGALRKLKGIADQRESIGAQPVWFHVCGTGIPPDTNFLLGGHGLLEVDQYATTDDGNGQHMADMFNAQEHGLSLRFISDWGRRGKWIIWDTEKIRWLVDDESGSIIRDAWRVVRTRQEEFAEGLKQTMINETQAAVDAGLPTGPRQAATPDSLKAAIAKYKKWNTWADRSGMNAGALEAIRNCASRNDRVVTMMSDSLDSTRELLAVENGVIDLSGSIPNLREPRISDMITLNTGIFWGEKPNEHGAKLWKEFLDIFLPNQDIREIVQMATGYSLLGGNEERAFLICIGQTSSGKSTFARITTKALGSYGGPVGKQMFQGQRFKPTLLRNAKKRLVSNTEFDNNVTLSTAAIKECTGSSDEIETERKGVDEVAINDIFFTPMIATNAFPRLNEPDAAVERRIYVLPFDEVLAPEEEKISFPRLLEQHALDSVLAWMLDGFVMYRENNGLIRNEYTRSLSRTAMVSMDRYSEFIDECIQKHDEMENYKLDKSVWERRPDWCVNAALLRNVFKQWWRDNDYPERELPSAKEMTIRLLGLGLIKPKASVRPTGKEATRYWLGIKMLVKPRQHWSPNYIFEGN